jgi:WD40 repeat protein
MSDGPVAISQDGSRAATSRQDRRGGGWVVTLWDVPRPAEGNFHASQKSVDRIDTGPGELALISGGKRARLWNTATGKAVAPSWTSPPIAACTWGAKPLAWVVDRSSLQGLDAATGEPDGAPIEFGRPIRGMAAGRDGRTAAVLTGDEIVCLDPATGAEFRRIPGPEAVGAMDLSSDGRILVFGTSRGAVELWSVDAGARVGEIPARESGVAKVSFCPKGVLLAVSYADKSVAVWDTVSKRSVGQPMTHLSSLAQTAWSPDGSILVTLDVGSTSRMWDSRTGIQIGPPIPRSASTIAVGSDARHLLFGDAFRDVRAWEMPKPVAAPASEIASWMRHQISH